MTQLHHLTIKQALIGLKNKDFTATELTRSHLDAMSAQQDLNAYITATPERALEQAQRSDLNIQKGDARVLEGIPMGVKDLFCTKGIRTTSASRMLENFIPTYESTVSAKLFEAGAVMLGKTNMDEFAMGSANINSYYGPVKNPWKAKNSTDPLVPGGSSGGSAAAVAAYIAMAALGSDTGGSIRQPAAFCGIVGIKPTYGRCSRYGMIAFASSLDQAGVFARNVEDTALVLEAIMGHDPKDSTSITQAAPSFEGLTAPSLRGMRIGIPKEYDDEGLSAEIRAIWQKGADLLRGAGVEIKEVSLPHTHHALSTYYIIAPAEASSNLARYDGVRCGLRTKQAIETLDEMYEQTRAEGFGAEVKRRIMIGTYVLSAGYYDAYYRKAQRLRTLIAQDFIQAFAEVDAILAPTAPTTAFSLGVKIEDPTTMYLNDIFTIPASLAGLPALSLPAALSENGLPLGLQLIGKSFDEKTILAIAYQLEQLLAFPALTP